MVWLSISSCPQSLSGACVGRAPPSLCSGFLRGQSQPGLMSPRHADHPPSEVFLADRSVFPEQVGAGPLPVHYQATARRRAPRQNILGFA